MANENASRDNNHIPTILAVTDDSNEETRMLRIDDTTKGILVSVAGGSFGTVTSISQGTGILLSSNPITTTGSISLATSLQPIATLTGNALKVLRVNAGETAVEYATISSSLVVGTTTITSGTTTRILYNNSGVLGEYTLTGSGTVVAMQTAPTFATSITTPSVLATANDSGALGASGTAFSDLFLASGAVINFNAGASTVTHSLNTLTIGGSGATTLALGTNSITMTGSIAATGARVTKGWFTDIESTNIPTVGGTAILTSLTAPQFTTIELGHASDTTLSRVSAGVVAIEGVNILTVAGGTLTGNITLGENTSIDLDPAGSADGKYSGICITGTAGATLAFGDLIYLAVADSRWELTDADASATGGPVLIGICVLAAAGDGSATKILLQGQIRADAKFPALTIGAPVYVGETAGAIQVAIPTGADNVIRVVGFALTADEIYFNPSQDHQITVA